MEIPIELLTDGVNKDRVLVSGKFVHAFRPKRHSKADEQDRFDQDDGKLQMRRDAAFHTLMVGLTMPTLVKANENKNEIGRPPNKERAHEPVTKLDDVIDLVAVLRSIHRLAEELIDEREATHTFRNLLPRAARGARAECARVARDEN